MATLYGGDLTRNDLARLSGDLSQVAGIRLMTLTEGREAGVRIADIRTGSGLRFQVTLDRGMDLSQAEYKGTPLAWRSPAGDVHPSYYEPHARGWLRTFPGGLMTGCGMTSAGAPSVDEGEECGQHGRLSHIPATAILTSTRWEGDECRFLLQGTVREYLPFSTDLVLRRTIETTLGRSVIGIRDLVRNQGASRAPLMMLYHFNVGWPLVSPAARLMLHATGVRPRDADAAEGAGRERECEPPSAGYREQVFYHDLVADAGGFTTAALVNMPLGLGIFVRSRKAELPFFTEWKMMGEGMYVVGLEPGNCLVEGRARERASGRLSFLPPGEEREFLLECGVLEGEEELKHFMKTHELVR
jgi:hypothetical protein